MSTDDFFTDDGDDGADQEIIDEWIEFESLISTLEHRCKKAKIPFQIIRNENELGDSYAIIKIPNGSVARCISFYNSVEIERILDIDFEKLTFLGSYAQ